MDGERINRATSRGQFEEFFNELNLTANIIPVDPPNLARPDHVDRFIALNRSPCRLQLSEPLLGLHAAFNRSVVLFQDVAQVLDRSVPTTAAKCPFLLYVRDGRAVDRRLIGVDDAGLWMRGIAQCLAKEPLAASASRNAESRKSIVAPHESMARYSSTSDPSLEHRSHRHARTCWSA
jgi:hypothetical protein